MFFSFFGLLVGHRSCTPRPSGNVLTERHLAGVVYLAIADLVVTASDVDADKAGRGRSYRAPRTIEWSTRCLGRGPFTDQEPQGPEVLLLARMCAHRFQESKFAV